MHIREISRAVDANRNTVAKEMDVLERVGLVQTFRTPSTKQYRYAYTDNWDNVLPPFRAQEGRRNKHKGGKIMIEAIIELERVMSMIEAGTPADLMRSAISRRITELSGELPGPDDMRAEKVSK